MRSKAQEDTPMTDSPPPALPRHVPLVVATRGDRIESVHYGSVAVADATGHLLYAAGDAGFPIFTRSALKPFQALPLVADGGPARFGFSAAQVALTCASHSGEPHQVAAVADMLRRIGCDESHLQCGSHLPLFYAATGQTPPADLEPSPLHHNCSGKHAGFLAWCRLHDQPVESYLDPEHPLQAEIRARLAHLVACEESAIPMGIDGCSAPNHALPLAKLAQAYAKLAMPPAEERDAAALSTLFQAMTAHPEMVSGQGRNDLMLMQAKPGDWVAKGGAEGMQALGSASHGLGIALKIADGSARAVPIAIAATLDQLGLLPPDGRAPRRWLEGEIRNYAGLITGRLLPVFALS